MTFLEFNAKFYKPYGRSIADIAKKKWINLDSYLK